MSVMSELHADLETIRRITEGPDSAEVQMERRCDFLIRELDELCAFAANSETVDLVESQLPLIGCIIKRARTLGFLLMDSQQHRKVA